MADFHYHVAGVLRVFINEGAEIDCKASDISPLPPGHGACVVGNGAVEAVDFKCMVNFAKIH